MRSIWFLVGLLLGAGAAQASITPQSPPQTISSDIAASLRGKLVQSAILARQGQLGAAAAMLDSIVNSDGFMLLPEPERYLALTLDGTIALENGRYDAAHGLLVQASHYDEADDAVWSARLRAAFVLYNYRDAALCVATLSRRWPGSMESVRSNAIYAIQRELAKHGNDAESLDMLQALFDLKWTDEDGEPSGLWRELARLLIDKGDLSRAKAVATRIRSARVALSMRVDKRFDPITQAAPQAFDVDRLMTAEIAEAQTRMKATPGLLEPRVHLINLLLSTREYGRALALADEAIEKVQGSQDAKPYLDFDEQYIWLLNARSDVLEGLGRWDEAAVQLARATRRPENGELNVSQAINLASLYDSLGRPDKALDAVAEVGPLSDFGRMQLEGVKLRAFLQNGDAAAAAKSVAYLREHRIDAIATWQNALLAQGDIDAAADVMVERLDNPRWRSDALVAAQEYADVPMTPVKQKIDALRQAMLKRPKVQAALAKVGRVERFRFAP
jgi:tetratricopeptide (TPR) repeat protein